MSWSSSEINFTLQLFKDPVNVYSHFYTFPLQLNAIYLWASQEELLNEFSASCEEAGNISFSVLRAGNDSKVYS
jgi:hypothetical protein